jgi:hypothetical protein
VFVRRCTTATPWASADGPNARIITARIELELGDKRAVTDPGERFVATVGKIELVEGA